MQIAVATYNVHGCIGNDRMCSPLRTAGILTELQCDVIALQEVDNHPREALEYLPLDFLATHTGLKPISGLRAIRHRAAYGNAILTRLNVLSVQLHDLTVLKHEPRGAIDVLLEQDGECVRVIATHLGLNGAERKAQIRMLMQEIEPFLHQTPVVLLGDFNEWHPRARNLDPLREQFGGHPAIASFPSWAPFLALDRIWVHPADALIETASVRKPKTRHASDHLPIRAVLSIGESR
jgi:endonuclease/exonuclease/phosphatase family metal-dependent hydrolase